MSDKKIPIGFDRLYYAIMSDEKNESYDFPVRLPGAISLNVAPSVNVTNLAADDITYDTISSQGPTTVGLGVAEIPTVDYAAILGHSIDANGGLVEKTTDIAPYVALLYRRKMANGKYRYVVLHKGRFQPPTEDIQTKGETVVYQTPSITATFIERTDGNWRYTANEGDANVTALFLSTFFDSVFVPGVDTTAPTVTVAPIDEATAVALDADVVWTFDKAIKETLVTDANFMVLDDTLAVVAGALSIDATGTIVTFSPTLDLTVSTTYTAMATANVQDLAGNALEDPSITTFTTTA